jgi:Thioesterase-like superfamily
LTPIFIHRLEVRFRDCDPMGHVNNAVYLTYLEQARFSHWRAIGIARGNLAPEGESLPPEGGSHGGGSRVDRRTIDRANQSRQTLGLRVALGEN